MFKRIMAFLHALVPLILLNIFEEAAALLMMLFAFLGSLIRDSSAFGWSVNFNEIVMNDDFGTMIMILYSLGSILFFGIWYYTRCEGEFGSKAFKEFYPLLFAGILIMVPGLQLMSSVVCIIIDFISPAAMQSYLDLIETAGVSDVSALMVVYSVILAPICEELAFRGITMRLFQRISPSFWTANVFQAVLFGIYHENLVQGLYAFCLGLFLGYVCEKGGTIYYSLILHMTFNFWGTVLIERLESMNLPDSFYMLLEAGMLACLFAGILIFNIGKKERDEMRRSTDWEEESEMI